MKKWGWYSSIQASSPGLVQPDAEGADTLVRAYSPNQYGMGYDLASEKAQSIPALSKKNPSETLYMPVAERPMRIRVESRISSSFEDGDTLNSAERLGLNKDPRKVPRTIMQKPKKE